METHRSGQLWADQAISIDRPCRDAYDQRMVPSGQPSQPGVVEGLPPSQGLPGSDSGSLAGTAVSGGTDLATQRRILIVALAIVDSLALLAAFRLAYILRFDLGLAYATTEGVPQHYDSVVATILPVWIIVFALMGLYDQHNLMGGIREYSLVFQSVSIGMLLVILYSFFDTDFVVARAWLLYSWLLAFLMLALARFAIRRVVYRLRTQGLLLARAIIIGTNDEGLALAEQLNHGSSSGLRLIGFASPRVASGRRLVHGLEVLGGLDDVEDLVDRYGIEELIVATSALHRADLVELFKRFNPRPRVNLRLSSGLFEVMTTGLEVKQLAYTPLVTVHPIRYIGIDRVMKFVLDYAVAATAVTVAIPLLLAIGLAVRLDSPGPVVHRRRVLGEGGRQFDCFKFRSMHIDGDSIIADHPDLLATLASEHKLKDDPRVTRVGRFLRRTSLDELPQFFNVLRGEMSVVGPRIISPEEQAKYGHWDMNLLTVKPGITGLWQVSGRSDVSYTERINLDMNYIRNWTIWLDLQILLQTLPAVLSRRGAY